MLRFGAPVLAVPVTLVALVVAGTQGLEALAWTWLGAGVVLLWALALPLEFALVLAVASIGGGLWSGLSADRGVGSGAFSFAAALGVVLPRLALHRGLSERELRPWLLPLGVLLVVAARWESAPGSALLAGLGAALLGVLGTDILLFQGGRRGTPGLKHLLGGAWILSYLLGAQLLLFGVVGPVALLVPGRAQPRLRRWARRGMAFMFDSFPYGQLERRGVSREELARPAVVVSNHQSSVDIPLVLSLPADLRILVNSRVWRTPILGVGARLLSHVLVERDRPERTLERCRERLAAGASLHAFPEGTRSQGAWPARFRRGSFELACELGVDVLPVVLHDPRSCVPRDAFWVGDFRMEVEALPRVSPRDFQGPEGALNLTRHVQGLVREAVVRGQRRRFGDPHLRALRVLERFRYQGRRVRRAVELELVVWRGLTDWDELLRDLGRVLVVERGYGIGAHWLVLRELRTRCTAWLLDGAQLPVARRAALEEERLEVVEGSEPPLDLADLDAAVLGPGVSRESQAAWLAQLPADCRVLSAGEPGGVDSTQELGSSSGASS